MSVALQTDTISEKMILRRNLLLYHIRRHGPIGRLELSRSLYLSKSRVCEVVQEMIDGGLILENLAGTERRGRQPVPLRANPEFGCYLGLDFEASRMRITVVDFAGEVLLQRQQKLKTLTSRQSLLSLILDFLDTGLGFIEELNRKALGIGLAAPGIIDRKSGILIHYDLMEAARNIPLRDLVENHTDLQCVVDNNIRCYALTEWTSGAAKSLSSFICLAVRSGVGSAIFRDGHLLDGSHGFSGEAGYFPVASEKPFSQWKTLQELVSEQALGVDVEIDNYQISESKARRAGAIVGAHAASLASLLDPEAIILAGALIQPDGPLWSSLESSYRRFILPDLADRVPLIHTRIGPFSAAVGATQRCFQEQFPTKPISNRPRETSRT